MSRESCLLTGLQKRPEPGQPGTQVRRPPGGSVSQSCFPKPPSSQFQARLFMQSQVGFLSVWLPHLTNINAHFEGSQHHTYGLPLAQAHFLTLAFSPKSYTKGRNICENFKWRSRLKILTGEGACIAPTKPWVTCLAPHKPGVMVHTCNPNIPESEERGLRSSRLSSDT